MTTTSARPGAFPFVTGFCSQSLIHERCRGVVAGVDCTCPCHSPEPTAAVSAVVEVAQPAVLNVTPPSVTPGLGDSTDADVDLGDALLTLTRTVADLDRALLGWDGNAFEVLDLLGHLREQRKQLAGLESLLELQAAKVMTGDLMEWPGGSAERRWGKDRKEWDHDGLASAVRAAIIPPLAMNPTTGEIDTDLAAVLYAAVEKYAATNRPAWRVTAVKPLGIDVDEFCHAVPGRPSVDVRLAHPEGAAA